MLMIAVWKTKPSNEGTVVRWIGARCRYWAGELPACGSVRIVACGSARIGGSLTDVKLTLTIFDKHLKTCGLDTIFYVGHPTDNTRMVAVNKSYVNLTIEHVRSEANRVMILWDEYDRNNNKVACELVMNLLGPSLFRDITSRDPEGTLPAMLTFMHVMANRASLMSDQVEATKSKLKALSPLKIPGHDIVKFATQVRELKLELDKVYAYDHAITKNVHFGHTPCRLRHSEASRTQPEDRQDA